jgi:hypothetical protein
MQPSWNRDQLTSGLVRHRSRLRCAWPGCVRSCTALKKAPLSIQHVVAADLHFSDRLLGPLISTYGHTSNRHYYFRLAYSGEIRGILSRGGGPSP